MAKYIDAERLKVEIERQVKESNIRQANLEAICQNGADVVESPIRAILKSLLSFIDTLSEEPVSEDLEKAVEEYITKVIDTAGHPGWDWETQDIIDAFIAGTKWQKEQMMKEAVEGEVYLYYSYNRDATAIYVDIPKENLGDKVRIIVLKAEED